MCPHNFTCNAAAHVICPWPHCLCNNAVSATRTNFTTEMCVLSVATQGMLMSVVEVTMLTGSHISAFDVANYSQLGHCLLVHALHTHITVLTRLRLVMTPSCCVHAEVCDAARNAGGDSFEGVPALPQIGAQPHRRVYCLLEVQGRTCH